MLHIITFLDIYALDTFVFYQKLNLLWGDIKRLVVIFRKKRKRGKWNCVDGNLESVFLLLISFEFCIYALYAPQTPNTMLTTGAAS